MICAATLHLLDTVPKGLPGAADVASFNAGTPRDSNTSICKSGILSGPKAMCSRCIFTSNCSKASEMDAPRRERKETVGAKGGRIGRPRKEVPVDAAKRIAKAATEGASMVGIAAYLGVSIKTLNRWLEEEPELKAALDLGREVEHNVLHSGLVQAAHKGNIVAAIFLLKARHGYREGDQGDTANRVSITFSLPGALKPEQFTVENDTSPPAQRLPAARSLRS